MPSTHFVSEDEISEPMKALDDFVVLQHGAFSGACERVRERDSLSNTTTLCVCVRERGKALDDAVVLQHGAFSGACERVRDRVLLSDTTAHCMCVCEIESAG